MDDLRARVDELEQREAFHELTIETLNQCLIDQQRQIEDLHNQLITLSSKLAEKTEDSQISLLDERPPHY
ncbi:SlyX family protein [Wohlfahrtiimonas chitiniclastica]|uniref:SlyX-like protein n=3 Tax=Wohlfahrtiimonas chitiniclastica TaxID=400946 RepID=L8Y1I4_9GAMM|nr:SlyX-like protein [Wohlfahrtiimonas chitiniclastica SH04]KZS22494.1 SlyX-like protein [Wohlfahrtiimonas chitiniclastica]KZX38008.1 SlyX protein [Wohlfahrtiimonas chitiniclastica]MBS7813918.1 SlyX family protein [Wohlfahrtiimonas chitiniclastica]MBS7816181.1 SlyX family protein [Wohlfahrtiimonas chitiniclastica]